MSSKTGILYLLLKDKYKKEDAKELARLIAQRQKLIKNNAEIEEIEDINKKIHKITDQNKGVNI